MAKEGQLGILFEDSKKKHSRAQSCAVGMPCARPGDRVFVRSTDQAASRTR